MNGRRSVQSLSKLQRGRPGAMQKKKSSSTSPRPAPHLAAHAALARRSGGDIS